MKLSSKAIECNSNLPMIKGFFTSCLTQKAVASVNRAKNDILYFKCLKKEIGQKDFEYLVRLMKKVYGILEKSAEK